MSKSALMASGFPQIFSHKILPPPHVFFFFSKNFLSRCIPDVVTENANVAGQLFSNSGAQDFFEELMGDLQNCGPQIVQMGVVALVFSLIITLLFRFLAGFIVYAIIGVVIVALAGGTITLWVLWYLKNKDIGGGELDMEKNVRQNFLRHKPDRQCNQRNRRKRNFGEQLSGGKR